MAAASGIVGFSTCFVIFYIMHTFSVILLPQDAADVRGRIQELFAPYYCELEIEEYKHFFDNEYALVMAQNHGAGEDLELLVRILREKGYEDVGLENGRFYRLSTFNVNAKWDYWGIGGRYDRRIYNEPTA